MSRQRRTKRPGPTAGSPHRAARRLAFLLGAVTAVALVVAWMAAGTPLAAASEAAQAPGQVKVKRYRATRAFVVDKQTGATRMPTEQEVAEVVGNLTALGQRPAESLPQASQANGTVSVDLEGAFGGVLLARPNEDGTWETRCVFTLEEGAAFLGIVEDDR